MMQKIHIQILVILMVFLIGCGSQGRFTDKDQLHPTVSVTQDLDITNMSVIHTSTQEGITYSLFAQKSVYSPGEIIAIVAQVENKSDQPLMYWMPNLEGPNIAIAVDADFMEPFSLREPEPVMEVHPSETINTLEINESITRGVIWDQSIVDGVPAPTGEYQIIATIKFPTETSDSYTPYTFEATISIKAGERLISQDEVIAIILADPMFQEWYATIGSVLVCQLWGREPVALVNGKVENVTDEIKVRLGTEKPSNCHITLEEGPIWEVTYANKYGPLEGTYRLLIDATNGEILEKEQHSDS